MKIGIVTVYNTYNCGSFLQAYALHRILKQKGHNVQFLKRKTRMKNRLLYIFPYTIYRSLLKGDNKTGKSLLNRYFTYQKHLKKFPTVKSASDLDAVVYGSDTIWNMEDAYFEREWKRYWGYGVKQKKVAYSVSVASTPEEKILNRQELKDCALEFSHIAARDDRTYDIVKKMLPEEAEIAKTVDPTMLLKPEDYKELETTCTEKDFILIYAFCDMKQEAMEEIRQFAKKIGKKIIAFGNEIPADINVPFDPMKMLGYYRKADYIVTNTFHGNVFSILFNKQFISYGKNKKKVEHLLQEFGLQNRLVDEKQEISSLFETEIDYEEINKKLEEKRNASLAYLDDALR